MDIHPRCQCHANAVPETPTLIPPKWYLAFLTRFKSSPSYPINSNSKKSSYVGYGISLPDNSLLTKLFQKSTQILLLDLNHTCFETIHTHSGACLSNDFLERVAESIHA